MDTVGKKASKMSLLFAPSVNQTSAYSDIQWQVKENISAGIWLTNFRVRMIELIQIKGYMCKIQLSGEENQSFMKQI